MNMHPNKNVNMNMYIFIVPMSGVEVVYDV